MLTMRLPVLFALCLAFFAGAAHGEIETRLINTVTLEKGLVDVALSMDGKTLYGLTDKGQLVIYDSTGALQGRMDVEPGFDTLRLGKNEDMVYLANTAQGVVKTVEVSFIHDIPMDGSPFKGPSDAPAVLVMFMDFQCPYCVRLHSMVEKVQKEYPKDLKVVLKHFPLSSHKFSMKAAQASMAAMDQGKFWDYFDKVSADYRNLSDKKLDEFRDDLSLDKKRFKAAMNSPAIIGKINRDKQDGVAIGVRATPTAFINGRKVKSLNEQGLKQAIDAVLKQM